MVKARMLAKNFLVARFSKPNNLNNNISYLVVNGRLNEKLGELSSPHFTSLRWTRAERANSFYAVAVNESFSHDLRNRQRNRLFAFLERSEKPAEIRRSTRGRAHQIDRDKSRKPFERKERGA